jgi:glyoxylase-like metal-dependent hydrolase (beta-lactamase superfamily II)
MLQIQGFTFNPFQENTYLIINEQKLCWIVDPGMFDSNETNFLFNYIEENGLKPQSIINTHTHIDHILGVTEVMNRYNIPFGVHEKDMPVLNAAVSSAMMFGLPFNNTPKPTFFIGDNDAIQLGDDTIEVRFTPGHSPGSVVFYHAAGNWVIGGDVLFQGSIGRTDLPGGNFDTLINSIRTQLFTLPDETVVYPGHGPATDIGNEKENNPFLN